MIHDYTRKRGIVHSEILLPSNAPPDFQDRGTLWNSVEQIEKACNSQLARELEVALPIELSREEQVRLVRAYCSSQLFPEECVQTLTFTTQAAATRTLIFFSPCDQWTHMASGVQSPKRNMCWTKTARESTCPAADTKRARLILWTGTVRRTPKSGARCGLTSPMSSWNGTTARSASTTAAMNGRGSTKSQPFTSAWQRHRWRRKASLPSAAN